jgi:hypothetical protein
LRRRLTSTPAIGPGAGSSDWLSELIGELLETELRSIAGLFAKARAARVLDEHSDTDQQKIFDIGSLAGEGAPFEAKARGRLSACQALRRVKRLRLMIIPPPNGN